MGTPIQPEIELATSSSTVILTDLLSVVFNSFSFLYQTSAIFFLCMGIPGNSQKRAVFDPGIPMGIPAKPDLGNSRLLIPPPAVWQKKKKTPRGFL